MKILYLFFLLLSIAASNEVNWSEIIPLHVTSNVLSENLDQRIVGGFEVEPNSLPYQVGLALYISSINRTAWCGGSLISKQYVITAAHCLELAKSAVVYLGAHNITNDKEETQVRIAVSEENFIIHEKWSRLTLLNDIALVKLPKEIELNKNIQPVNLPTRSQQNDKLIGKTVLASGWGKESDQSKRVSQVLRAVKNPVISKLRCTIFYFGVIRNSHICMSGRGAKSTCSGDSGGPLVLEKNNKKVLVGTTSFGIAFGCEKKWPGVFTRITYYLDWISEKTGIHIEP